MHDEEFGEGASGDLLVSSSCFNSFPLAFLLMQRFLLDLSGYRNAAVDVRVELYNLALDFLLAEATPATPCSLYGVGAFQNAAMTDQWTGHQDLRGLHGLQRFCRRQSRRTRRDARLICHIFGAKRKVASDDS